MPSYIQNSPESRIQAQHSASQTLSVLDTVNPAELGLVVDQSGSMELLADQLVASFNILLDDQKKIGGGGEEGAVFKRSAVNHLAAVPPIVSLSLFSNSVHQVHDGIPAVDVPALTLQSYQPDGGTALNDGIGAMIQSIGHRAKHSTKVMIAILTDGGENSSHQFSSADILQMISYRRINYDWQFVFIGPESARSYGVSIGIPAANIVSFDADLAGLKLIMDRLSKSVRAYQLGDRKYALKLGNS